ncbi:MAG: polyprenyl synthetase family protein [bacterium]|nr:polyprenyl synthetase family protein [bacterium]
MNAALDADLAAALAADRRLVEAALRRRLAPAPGFPPRLRQAMAHSLLGGGKRLRPLLLLWTYDALRTRRASPRDEALAAAVALEMIHTYSLVHDDLPAMDDDDLRRGRPTCHVAFDEATAILAGDGLQALAFEILAGIPRRGADLVRIAAAAAGPSGMVGGQQEDLDAAGRDLTAALIRRIHAGKTARLIGAPLAMGALLAGRDAAAAADADRAGRVLGLAFQAADDLLDVEGSTASLGKTAGKDADQDKATWVRLEGAEAARARTARLGRRGTRELQRLLPPGPEGARLLALVRLLWERDR